MFKYMYILKMSFIYEYFSKYKKMLSFKNNTFHVFSFLNSWYMHGIQNACNYKIIC